MDSGRVKGYEYDYRFSTDDNQTIAFETVNDFKFTLARGFNVFQFEITAYFILKKGLDDYDFLCSENFCLHFRETGHEWTLKGHLNDRLKEYWMLDHEIQRLVREALVFARRQRSNTARVIPLVVDIYVFTVRQDGEGLEAASDRAIRVEKLVPLCLLYGDDDNCPGISRANMVWGLPRKRVEEAQEGLSLMETCPICLGEPSIGSQISALRSCGHAFHYHCIVRWLMKNDTCPLCRAIAYNDQLSYI